MFIVWLESAQRLLGCYTASFLTSCYMLSTESEEDYDDLTEAVRLVRDVIAVVDNRVNEHEKRRRLKEFHSRLDSKSIMMMKNGQIFAREDLLRRRLIHEGALQLKNNQGRLKGEERLADVFIGCYNSPFVKFYITVFKPQLLVFCWSSRCPCSAAIRCFCLSPRERPEICLCHAGKILELSLSFYLS